MSVRACLVWLWAWLWVVPPLASAQDAPAPPAPVEAPSTAPAAPFNPLVSEDPIQPNGDWERWPVAVHVPFALGVSAPFGSVDGHPNTGFASNAGTFVNFELGVGVRVRRWLAALMFSIGGAGVNGPMASLLESQGYEPGSTLRIFFGLDGAYYLQRSESWAIWLGPRFGYGAALFSGHAGDTGLSYSFGGLYLAARAGADFRMAPAFGMGPYIELGVGRFLSGSVSASIDDDLGTVEDESYSTDESLDLDGGAFHGYIGGGLRAVIFP